MDSLICRGADTRPGARMVLKGGGGANHHHDACREHSHSGNAHRTAGKGRVGDTARERQTRNHDDFSEFGENLRKL
jgi:hypothetical protein